MREPFVSVKCTKNFPKVNFFKITFIKRRPKSAVNDRKVIRPSCTSPRSSINSNSNSNLSLLHENPKYSSRDNHDFDDGPAYRRYGRHKSGHAESRTRKVRPQARQGKSEQPPETNTTATNSDPDKTPLAEEQQQTEKEEQPSDDPAIAEREAKRKEIESLIQKYAALDEIYAKSAADAIASKYQKKSKVNNANNNNVGDAANHEDEIDDDFVLVKKHQDNKKLPIVVSRESKLSVTPSYCSFLVIQCVNHFLVCLAKRYTWSI